LILKRKKNTILIRNIKRALDRDKADLQIWEDQEKETGQLVERIKREENDLAAIQVQEVMMMDHNNSNNSSNNNSNSILRDRRK
jgi:hypothetical protein